MLMKKILSGLLVTVIIISSAASVVLAESKPATAQSAEAENVKKAAEAADKTDTEKRISGPLLGKDSLEKVIGIVKGRLNIPEAYKEFSGDVYDDMGKTMFRLRWYSSSDYYSMPGGGSMEVDVDENGNIIRYYHYKYNTGYDNFKKIPKIRKDQALDSARKFVSTMCPDLLGKLIFETEKRNGTIDYEGNFTFTFYRQHNNVLFDNQYVSVQVNGKTGDIANFNRNNWNDTVVFPEASGMISPDDAKAAYRKNISLQLRYRRDSVLGGNTTYLEYSPGISDFGHCIDAISGEKVTLGGNYNPYYEAYRYSTTADRINLPQKDLDELKQFEGLISPESAEKLARGITELGMDGTYKLNRYNYEKTSSDVYTLRLEFMQAPSKENFPADYPPEKLKVMIASGEGGAYVGINFNARNGEIITFNANNYNGKTITGGKLLDRTQMQKTAEAFLKRYKSVKFNQTELDSIPSQVNEYAMKFSGVDSSNPGSFVYTRKVNSISYEDNKLTLTIDPATGKITTFNETWDDVNFISTAGIITRDSAYQALFKANPLELRYIIAAGNTGEQAVAKYSGGQANGEVKLVYTTDMVKPVCLDAKTGTLINYNNGQPYIEVGVIAYNDVGQHAAKQEIQALAEMGVLPNTSAFEPDEKIIQKEYLYILSRIKGNYYMDSGIWPLKQKDQDGLYRVLVNESILDEAEKEPDAYITSENAVKYLLRAAGYRKFAELKGIFECKYADKADIDPALTGYAAIAGSLGIVNSTASFEPKKALTKAEAVILLYNYMNR